MRGSSRASRSLAAEASAAASSTSPEALEPPLTDVITDILSRMGQIEQETSTRQLRMQEIYACVQELKAQIEKLETNVVSLACPYWLPL